MATHAECQPDSIRYFDLMGEADKAIAGDDWNLAEQKLLEALRLMPANPVNILLLSNLGMIRFHAGKTDEAIATLTDAHTMAPASVTILQNRARIYAEIGRDKDAINDYASIIALDSTLVEPLFYHAMLSINAGDLLSADTDVTRLKTISSNDRLTYLADATLALHTGLYAQAISPLSHLIDTDPTAGYYASRSLCRLMLGQLQEASDDIARGLEIDPVDSELYIYRALLNKMRYRPEDAKSDARRAIELGADATRVNTLIQ